jgi:hypothetical protein
MVRVGDGGRHVVKVLFLIVLLIALPLIGVILAGKPIDRYLEFPPHTRYVEHPPFSWQAFVILGLAIMLSVAPLIVRVMTSRVTARGNVWRAKAYPWWGVVGAVLTAVSWWLAWSRFEWFESYQASTFTPLWLGYILFVNAWTYARTGRCMMLDQPRMFLWLFPVSAGFWWSFEYLNRFVQNWYYVGAQTFTTLDYFMQATVPFSTVLPAVLSTRELLGAFPRLSAGMDRLPSFHIRHVPITGWGVFILACAGLVSLGIWPSYAFPLVWLAPLALMTSLQMVTGEETIFSATPRGDWRSLWGSALAAVVCGICWELWNYKSLAHWEYAIPFVDEYKIFNMPLLGYAGYLPFGLECLAVAQFLFPGHDVERMTPKTKSSFQVKDHRHLTDGGPAMSAEEFAEEGRLFKV